MDGVNRGETKELKTIDGARATVTLVLFRGMIMVMLMKVLVKVATNILAMYYYILRIYYIVSEKYVA